MPQELTYTTEIKTDEGWGERTITATCATEQEIMEFANRIRKAGGAEVLDALLPSSPQNPQSCLIANALNFGCEVLPCGDRKEETNYERRWKMLLPYNAGDDQVAGVRSILGDYEDRVGPFHNYHFLLPQELGNAADAFDHGHYADLIITEEDE